MNRSIQSCLASVAVLCASLSTIQALPSSANIQLWFEADAGVTTNGSGNVSTWADQSGNGNNATNLTVANEPLWIGNALNGKPVLRFDGVNDELSSLNDVNLTNGLSIFIIAKNATRKNYNGLFRIGAVPYTDPSDLEVYWQAGTTDAGSGNAIFTVNRCCGSSFGALQGSDNRPAVGNYYVYDVVTSGSAGTQRVNAVVGPSVSGINVRPLSANKAHLGIGYGGVSTSGLLSGDIAEVIVYNSALSTSDRNYVESYLADKYGLTIPEADTIAYLGMSVAALLLVRHRRHSNA
jgi:hypothetical protein